MIKKIFSLMTCVILMMALVGCGDFLPGPDPDNDPNRPTDVPAESCLVGVQVNSYGVLNAHINRTVAMWMQQMAGVAQHYSGYDIYNQTPTQFSAAWFDIYGGGGLIDARDIQKRAAAENKPVLEGIAKMWEALLMSYAADVWGDIPYSEAASEDIPYPHYDKQSAAHNAILDLINEAIADINTGQDDPISIYDFTFGADAAKWAAAGHTLKARILLNWAEVDPGKYAAAMAEAQQGIASDADNWATRHSEVTSEENPWWQFESARFGYVRAGNFMVELLRSQNDPRLAVYFEPDANGEYHGSKPGEFYGDANALNLATFGAKAWNTDMVSWFENEFIMAECEHAAGNASAAITRLNDVIQPGLEAKFGLATNALPRYDTALTGDAALSAIMTEKYKAMFLNMQVWSDWRRTGYPVFTETGGGKPIPRRLLYSQDELNVNPNTPVYADPYYQRVENDPN